MNNEKYSKLKYNNKLIKYLEEAYIYLKEYNPVAYKYNWNTEKKIKIEKFEEIDSQENKWVNYYWIEFEKIEVKYKFSLFYKDFDRKSGNIHVLPGAVQLWKKEKNDYCKLNKMKKEDYAVPFVEDEWYPQFNKIHYIYNDIEDCLSSMIEKKTKFKRKRINNEFLYYYEINNINYDFINFNPEKIQKYPIIKWKCYPSKRNQKYWISYYFSEFDFKNSIFSKYGQIQFWRGISASPCSPSEYEEEEGWKLFYPETSNKYKIKGISEWLNKIKKGINLEKTKLKDFIDLVKNGQKAFDPDINIENLKDMERLDNDFNEFKRICNIIENNIEKSVEEILKLI